jgi:hypothetical protein
LRQSLGGSALKGGDHRWRGGEIRLTDIHLDDRMAGRCEGARALDEFHDAEGRDRINAPGKARAAGATPVCRFRQ